MDFPPASLRHGYHHFPLRVLGSSPPQRQSTWKDQAGRCAAAAAVAARFRTFKVTRTAKNQKLSPSPEIESATVSAEETLQKTMAEVSKKLGLFESVRHVCQSVEIPLPGVVVVGEQSAGKSSLLENISGIQFPRAQNTCTRMPCVLTLLSDSTVGKPFAMVSMNPSFADAKRCDVPDVETEIKRLTEKHATEDQFISSKAMYIRVVRKEGPQLSLIDLPGVTHNADQMSNIHEVTVSLVEEYIKPEEMVILCVIPATSDFGNAEVVKLARKYDADGVRTLGVVTKCDDAANAEASDVVEKVMMTRDSDVRLELGFHCVVNRSQKNIDEGMGREDLWAKERDIFTKYDRMKRLPQENWGTLRLMEKVAKIQEARVDECLPKIREDVRNKTQELQAALVALPAQPETEGERSRVFNEIVSRIRDDLVRRIRAEFMTTDQDEREFTIAPRVEDMVQNFKKALLEKNPRWLEKTTVDEVESNVQSFLSGYTVPNLIGPHVFTNLFKQTFIEGGLLKRSVDGLVTDVGEHLRKVVMHVVDAHACDYGILSVHLDAKAQECIDQLTSKAGGGCEMLADAQRVTSTTYGQYAAKLMEFRSYLLGQKEDSSQRNLYGSSQTQSGQEKLVQVLSGPEGRQEIPQEFLNLAKEMKEEPAKLATLEICASLHVYTGLMIEGFVEMSAKLVKSYTVEQLADKLEETWREELGGSALDDLFPTDQAIVQKKKDLTETIEELLAFKDQLTRLQPSRLAGQRRPRLLP